MGAMTFLEGYKDCEKVGRSIYEDNYKRVIIHTYDFNCTNVAFYISYKAGMDSKRAYMQLCISNMLGDISA